MLWVAKLYPTSFLDRNHLQLMENKASKNPFYIQPKAEFKHRLGVQIRFNDIDALGHVNNAIYMEFFDLGKATYFTDVNGGPVDWRTANVVVANVNCNYLAPIYFHEPIEVQTQAEYVHDRSVKLLQQLVNTSTGEVKCQCVVIMVGFDVKAGVSAPISDDWKQKLSAFEGRNLD